MQLRRAKNRHRASEAAACCGRYQATQKGMSVASPKTLSKSSKTWASDKPGGRGAESRAEPCCCRPCCCCCCCCCCRPCCCWCCWCCCCVAAAGCVARAAMPPGMVAPPAALPGLLWCRVGRCAAQQALPWARICHACPGICCGCCCAEQVWLTIQSDCGAAAGCQGPCCTICCCKPC